ncbi:MAG: ATP-binding protein [Solirubrobacterales bacterium]|jgi:anti-sigma regulatory factor (Ser/Thr protein kinase)|nr:ATP-binding protein [Solirubrobacterales bacterium]
MRLSLTLAADATAPSRARTSIRALSLGLSPHTLRDVQLVVSELVTNAVEHGPRERIGVELELRGRDDVRGEIVDQGVDGAPRVERAEDDPTAIGLRVVEALTTRWGVHAGSTHVWFEMTPRG